MRHSGPSLEDHSILCRHASLIHTCTHIDSISAALLDEWK